MFKLSLVKIKVASVCYLVGGCDRAKVHYAWSNRQLCWAHVLRTFDFLAQSHRYKAHGKRLVQNAESLFRYSQNLEQKRSQSMNTFHLLRRSEWTSNYSSINWTRGWASHPWREARSRSSLNMKLIEHEAQLWTFLKHPELKIHNNDQERALRTAVIKRKLSFGNDTWDGAHTFAQLLSVIQTLKRQKRSIKEWFISLFESQSPSLIPTL